MTSASKTTNTPIVQSPESVQVWDLFLRLFHWLLVLTLGVSWLTAELGVEYREYHFYSGYFALGLLVFRMLWGVWGTSFARFTHFLRGPAATLAYARARLTGQPPPITYPGHNPVGGLAIVALLGLIGVQAVSGLFADDDILYTGPWREAVSSSLANDLTSLHHSNFDFLLGLVALHLIAIVVYRLRFNEYLTSAMLHGRKSVTEFGSHLPLNGIPWLRALIAIVLAAAGVWLMLELAPEPVYDDYYY